MRNHQRYFFPTDNFIGFISYFDFCNLTCFVFNILLLYYQGTPSAVEGIICHVGWLKRYWSPTMFKEMHRLWLLDLHQTLFRDQVEHVEYLPDSLKCLIWPHWSWKSLPSNFMAHNLVELRMANSELEKLWSEVQVWFNFNIFLLRIMVCKN